MNSKTKKTICLLIGIASILTIVSTVSYAYFTARGEVKQLEATISTGTTSVRFADNDTGITGELKFGESITKKFTIQNTGTAEARVKMYWKDLVNTYIEGSLTYVLRQSESNEGPYTEVVGKTNVPKNDEGKTLTEVLAESLTIPVGKIYYYELVITLNYLEDVNQDPDLSAKFSSTFELEDINYTLPSASEKTLAKLGVTSKGTLDSFVDIAPKPTQYKDNNFNGNQNNYNMTNFKTNYITYADSYTFDSNTGSYTLTNPQVCQYQSCYTTLREKYVVNTTGNTTNEIVTSSNLGTIYKVGTGTTTTSMPYIESSKTVTNYDYSKDGIYELEDDYGTSYYYRGAVENNYVKFGKNKSSQDMYWRIVRINGDGSLRIIYDGTSAHVNGEVSDDRVALKSAVWNTTHKNDAKYVGYMYGGTNGEASTSKEQAQANETDSNIKTQLETWYKENILDTGFSSAVSDEIFCNDRSFEKRNTGTGFGTSETYYGARGRLGTAIYNPQPSFKCLQKNDAFTVKDKERGNGALKYPIGLITADEITTSGGRYYQSNGSANNYQYYLYKGLWYWSLSPIHFNTEANVFGMNVHGILSYNYVNNTGAGAGVPVINLSSEYVNTMIGTGTMTDPYREA